MQQYNFLEWIKVKEALIDEAVGRQRQQMGYTVEGNAKAGDIVISNPLAFFKKILYVPKGVGSDMKIPKLRDNKVSPDEFSSWTIGSIDNRTVQTNRLISGTYASKAQGAQKFFDLKRLRDVTDSFVTQDVDLLGGGKGNKRYFVDLGKTDEVEKLYKVYQQLTRHSALGGVQGQQDAAMRNLLAGDDVDERGRTKGQQAVASMINKGADDAKVQQFLKLADYANAADMTQFVKDDTHDPKFVQWIRRIGAGKLIDQMHEKGMSQLVAGEEKGPTTQAAPPMEEPDLLSRILGNQQSQQPQQNPANQYQMHQGRQVIPTNPQQMGAVNQGRNPQQNPFDALFRKAESYDTMINPMINENFRYWKSHNDRKKYSYVPE